MPRTRLRCVAFTALLTVVLATSAAAFPLEHIRGHNVHHHQPPSILSVLLHVLIGASGGIFDPNGGK